MAKTPLVIVGAGAFAEVACEYFTHDTDHEVVAFAVERPFITRDTLLGRPVVPFDELPAGYPPGDVSFHVAITYFKLNQVRRAYFERMRELGYRAASYISPRAFVWPNAVVGEHCFLFEHVTVQPFASIGQNVVVWTAAFLGHHSSLGDHCFVGAHVAINGSVQVGSGTFVGANATLANHINVGCDSLVGAGTAVFSDVEAGQLVMGTWRKKTITTTSRLQSEFFLVDQ